MSIPRHLTTSILLTSGYSQSRNPRRPPEETGPFGKRRNARYETARSRTRTGTPAKRENQNIAEFGRLFALQQETEKAQGGGSNLSKSATSTGLDNPRKPTEKVATECMIYGYRSKESEWKVIDKYERISTGFICEDYPRSDPKSSGNYSQLLSGGGDVVIRANLSPDAKRKSKRYSGGFHWIKVTFDSTETADRACFFSPQEIDGHLVFCELFNGHGPAEDIPIRKDSPTTGRVASKAPRSLTNSHSTNFLRPRPQQQLRGANDRIPSLPRSPAVTNLASVADADADANVGEGDSPSGSSITASSATATGAEHNQHPEQSTLHHRHPNQPNPESEFMTHIPTVRKTRLRPISEALPPQPTVAERVLRSIPILSWFTGDIVGDGPQLREDGSFDYERSNVYWRFWYTVDRILGTDICGLREES